MADAVFSSPEHIVLPFGKLPKDYFDLGTILGPFFLAQCFNWCLYGCLILQAYIYWTRFPRDLTYIKWLVGVVFLLDTLSLVLVTHAAWKVLVSHWGDVNIFHELPWTWASVPVSSGIISGIVQMFFVWRIVKLGHSFVMPFIIFLVIIVQAAFAIRTGVIAYNVRNFHYIRDLIPAFWLGGSMLADTLISGTLARILWTGRTGFSDTDGLLMRVMRLTIEAAAVPTLAAGIKLALIYTSHDNKHLVFCVVLARLYSNTFLAMLNCRDPLLGGDSHACPMPGASRLSESRYSRSIRHSVGTLGANSQRGAWFDNTYNDKNTPYQRHSTIEIDPERRTNRSSQISLDDMSRMDMKHSPDDFPMAPITPNSHSPWHPQFPTLEDSNNTDVERTYDTRSQFPASFLPNFSPISPDSPPQVFSDHPLAARPIVAKPEQSYWRRASN